MSEEYVVLVDEFDNPVGMEEKVRCHLPDGRLHRAFTALLFDRDGRLALCRRAAGKMLWPGYWDGTFASHPRDGETYAAAGERRMPEELGASCALEYACKFEYHARYENVGSENEICATLIGTVDDHGMLGAVPGEIDGIRWVSASELLADVRDNPGSYCPWMLIALGMLEESGTDVLERHGAMEWRGIMRDVRDAIAHHIPEDQWRLARERD